MDALNNEQISKIRTIIAQYKAFMQTEQSKEEWYKWKALAHFHEHWDIDAVNFAEMLEESLRETGNLLGSGTYYPKRMLLQFAERNPEGVREAFRRLYENERPLVDRFEEFCGQCQKFTEKMEQQDGKKRKHFQDPRAVSWYLSFRFPTVYFPYKHSVYQNAIQMVDYPIPETKHRTPIWKAECSQDFCRLFLEQVKQDEELLQLHRARLPELWEEDPAFHLLVFDILFFMEKYLRQTEPPQGYWPSLEEYDPEISVEQWKELLQDQTVTYPDTLMMLTMMLQEGGESTCAHLSERYGRSPDFYNLNGRMFAERVKRKLGCPDCVGTDGVERVFPVAFVGKSIKERGMNRYVWRMRGELKEALKSMELKTYAPNPGDELPKFPKNMILYGPPGTGKTYHTVLYAVAILEGKTLEEVENEAYQQVFERYQTYKKEGRIAFITFHQSYGYEDFIEGIRPDMEQKDEDNEPVKTMIYKVQPGVFKDFCKEANKPVALARDEYALNENPAIWKVSLEGTGDNATRAECLQNGHIRIGWDGYGEDLSEQSEYKDGGARILNTFYNRMRVGDLVFSCYSATQIDAIGVITGGPEWHDEYPDYKRVRKVKWLAKGFLEDIQAINDGHAMVQGTVYQLWNVSLENAYKLIETYGESQEQGKKPPYVFIIDEINRGNISKIFGELITLLEENKRLGGSEEMRVKLPYSAEPFGVPENVYMIGTMNTADRSIMALDTALRRRFDFVEMLPEPQRVFGELAIHEGDSTIVVADLLNKLNCRIEALYDREHTIGHAYLMPLMDHPTVETLGEIFTDKIIPLLQEYFFDDYEKIRLVLGDNQKQAGDGTEFITVQQDDYQQLFGTYDVQQEAKTRYQLDRQAAKRIKAYRYLR